MSFMNKKLSLGILGGFLLGVFWLGAIRFFTYKKDTVHYHANFAVYINDKRLPFDSITDYEEVSACTVDGGHQTPPMRVHMHDQKNWVIHIHDSGVTWQHFFENLGMTVTNNLIQSPDGKIYESGENSNNLESDEKISYVLNGEKITKIVGLEIKDTDTLLVSYGNDSQDIMDKQYKSIDQDAKKVDAESDPATCSGSAPVTMTERLKHAFWLQ